MTLLLLIVLLMTTSVVCDTAAYINGTWSPVQPWPLYPIHMVLLKSGKVLSYGNKNNGKPELKFWYDVWDPTTNTHQTLPTDYGGDVGTNIFCTGQATVPTTGEVLLAGGSVTVNDTRNYGTAYSQFYNDDTKEIRLADQTMHLARWYPTVTVLGNSQMVVQGGRDDTRDKKGVTTPEIYNPKTGKWRLLPGANHTIYGEKRQWWYPRSFATKGNTVIVLMNYGKDIWKLDMSGDGSLDVVATVAGPNFNLKAPATMFDRNKILAIQGVQDASVIDISNPDQPTATRTGSLRERRYWANSVALPNGEVLVVGGATVDQVEENAVKYAEIWNPISGEWRTGATAVKSRLYHSAALLLPDATVLVGGGGPPGPVTNDNAEIYTPPYLFKADGERATRPVITSLSTSEPTYGQTIQVDFQSATTINRVSLIRLGSVTHSFNMDERMIRLNFEQNVNALDVEFSFSKSVAPPGWYMLFIVNDEGVPSVAKIVNLQS